MRYLSVCSGIEAASVAWQHLGWEAVGFSEIEPFPCAVLAHHFPNTPNYGSLTEYQSWPLEPGSIDLLVGGTPCQSFSVAGLRKGLADPRGNLCLTFLGLADRLKPKWIIWENVPGVLSSDGGRDFGSFLGALVQLGYGFAYRVLDAQNVGGCALHGSPPVPQRRRRVFVVACLGDWTAAAEVLALSEGLPGHIEASGKKGKGVATDAGSGVEAYGIPRTVGTLCADSHPGSYSGQDAYTGRLIPVPCHDSNIIGTLCARDYKGIGTQYVQEGKCIPLMFKIRGGSPVETGEQGGTPGKAAGKGYLGSEDKAFTIATSPDQWLAQQAGQAISFQPGNLCRKADPSSETFPTLTKDSGDQSPHVCYPVVALDGMNLLSRLGPCGESHSIQNFIPGEPMFTLKKGGNQHGVLTPMAVRRLTPTECERLQGFPDNWSQIPWKGKPAEDCPDGPRYKACGNSMAVPVMRWIGERINNLEASK